jgi:hypothetical protein
MILIFIIIPFMLWLIAMGMFVSVETSRVRRIIFGVVTLCMIGTASKTLSPVRSFEFSMRRMAYDRLEQSLKAGDTNRVIAAFESYQAIPRNQSDYWINTQIVKTLEATKRDEPK